MSFANDLSLDVRATLNPILNTTIEVSQFPPDPGTYAEIIDIENFYKLNRSQAYKMIVSKGWADKDIDGSRKNLNPLLDQIIEHVEPAKLDKLKPCLIRFVSNRVKKPSCRKLVIMAPQ